MSAPRSQHPKRDDPGAADAVRLGASGGLPPDPGKGFWEFGDANLGSLEIDGEDRGFGDPDHGTMLLTIEDNELVAIAVIDSPQCPGMVAAGITAQYHGAFHAGRIVRILPNWFGGWRTRYEYRGHEGQDASEDCELGLHCGLASRTYLQSALHDGREGVVIPLTNTASQRRFRWILHGGMSPGTRSIGGPQPPR